MARLPITKQHVCLGASSPSALTGNVFCAADYQTLTVSFQSSVTNGSRLTIIGTNDDGFQSALGTPSQTLNAGGWSIVTVITSSGIYTMDPGIRWVNAFRDPGWASAGSNCTVVFEGKW